MMRRTPSCRLLRRMPMQVDGDLLLLAFAVMAAKTVPKTNDDSNDSE
jgi:hypothetical protein